MINAERQVSYQDMKKEWNGRYFKAKKNEKYWRIGLISVIIIGWLLILSLAYFSLIP